MKNFLGHYLWASSGQAFGLVAGFALIHLLTRESFAAYTVFFALASGLSQYSDLGAINGFMAVGGDRMAQNQGTKPVFDYAYKLRRWLLAIALVFVIPATIWMIRPQVSSTLEAAFLGGCAYIYAVLAVGYQLKTASLKLHGQVDVVLRQQTWVAAIRLAGCGLVLLTTGWLQLGLVVVTLLLSQYAGVLLSSRSLARVVESANDPLIAAEQSKFRHIVKRQAINQGLYVGVGLLPILAPALLGVTGTVADIGALGRIAAIFGVIQQVVSASHVPAMSKAKNPSEFQKTLGKALVPYIVLGLLVLASVFILPQSIVLLLGEKYRHLEPFAYLIVFSAIIAQIGGLFVSATSCRGWIIPPLWNGIILLGSSIGLVPLFDFTNTQSILYYGLTSATFGFVMYFTWVVVCLRRWKVE